MPGNFSNGTNESFVARLGAIDEESIVFMSRLLVIETFSRWLQLVSIIVSYIGNVCSLLVSRATPERKKAPIYRTLVKYLAVTDLVYSTAQIFLVYSRFNGNRWVFGGFACKFLVASPVAITTSLNIVMLVAVERYRCLVEPFKKKLRWEVMRRILCLLIIFSICLYLPAAIQFRVTHDLGYAECRSTFPTRYQRCYDFIVFAFAYLLPVTVVTFCYARIAWRALQNFQLRGRNSDKCSTHVSSQLPPDDKAKSNGIPIRNRKSQKRLISTLLAIVLVFLLTITPNQVYILWSNFASSEDDGNMKVRTTFIALHSIACLVHVHSWVNPIIYFVCDRQFREALRKFASKWVVTRCYVGSRKRGGELLPKGNCKISFQEVSTRRDCGVTMIERDNDTCVRPLRSIRANELTVPNSPGTCRYLRPPSVQLG